MSLKNFIAIVFCLFTVGCASWFQAEEDEPLPYNPESWYQQTWDPFSGAKIRAGYSEADITPSRAQWLAGYNIGRKSKTVVHPLRAQCLALEDNSNNEKIMIVGLDLLGILPDFIEGVLSQVTSWPHDRILFSSSHTHSAPDTYGRWGNGLIVIPLTDGKDHEYIKRIQEDIAKAIEKAATNMDSARIRFGTGAAPNCISEGEAGVTPDVTISMLQVAISNDIVTLFNYSLHPDLNKGRYVTPDFVYFLRQYFEAKTNGRMIFVNGAIGAVEPVLNATNCDTNYQNQGRGVRAREIGEELAEEAITIMQNPILPTSAEVYVDKEDLEVELKNWQFKVGVSLGLLPKITDSTHDWKIKTPIYYVEIGPAQILTVPGELFPERWEEIQPKLTGQPKFIFGLTHVGLGYIMSKADFESGVYDYYAKDASIGDPEFGEKLIQTYKQLIRP